MCGVRGELLTHSQGAGNYLAEGDPCPLSAKGHAVGQRGSFAGLAIDTYKGRFYMLLEKLSSMVTARDDLVAASLSTPRVIARVRGKALSTTAAPFPSLL
jgi:hypothetical protein